MFSKASLVATYANTAAPRRRRLIGLAALLALPLAFAGPSMAASSVAKAPAVAQAPAAKKKAKAPKAGKTATAAKPAESAPAEAPPVADEPLVPAGAGESPMSSLKKSHDKLRKVIGKSAPNWSPEAQAQTTEIRKLVNGFLDFGELGRRALSAHWEGLAPTQRSRFVSVLQQLVERSYVGQLSGEANYQLLWEKENVAPTEASVTATLKTVARGKKIDVAMEYKMLHKQRGWVVYDVLTDEQSLLETYRAEFNKIIRKDGFDALIARMEKRLAEKDKATAAK